MFRLANCLSFHALLLFTYTYTYTCVYGMNSSIASRTFKIVQKKSHRFEDFVFFLLLNNKNAHKQEHYERTNQPSISTIDLLD